LFVCVCLRAYVHARIPHQHICVYTVGSWLLVGGLSDLWINLNILLQYYTASQKPEDFNLNLFHNENLNLVTSVCLLDTPLA